MNSGTNDERKDAQDYVGHKLTDEPMKSIIKLVSRTLAIALLVIASLLLLTAFPAHLFCYSYKIEQLTFRSDHPFDHTKADLIGQQILQRLAQSPLGLTNGEYTIYIANEKWRRILLWNVIAPATAFGFAAYPLTNEHVFLSGADFENNQLISPDGKSIAPSRSLVYYGTHELAHVRTGETLGAFDHLTLPTWIMEGLADYAAFQPLSPPEELYQEIKNRKPDPELWNAHGYYAKYRLAVQYYLEVRGWTLSQLFDTKLTFEDAWLEVSTAYE